jgi:beta-lactamase class A
MKFRYKIGIIAIASGVIFAAGATTGFMLGQSSTASQQSSAQERTNKYPLLAKRILIDNPNDAIVNFVPLRKALEQKFKNINAPHSFSFEYLPTGTTIRVGDSQELVGASLLKLPVVMDLYRAAELGKIKLDDEVALEQDMLNSQYGTLYLRGAGAKLTLRQAARIAIEQSDNTAILLIQRHISNLLPADADALAFIDADYNTQGNTILISSKSYSSIIKCLYFACFNNFDSSQEILSYLSNTQDNTRITANIPENITVAHKFGTNGDTLTDSDCGIFYVPKRPYILCMMVGLPEGEAEQFEAEVSRLVYDTVVQE